MCMEQLRNSSTQTHQIPTSVSLSGTNFRQRFFWNSYNNETSSCCFLAKCVEANPYPRIFVLQTSEMLVAILDKLNSNEQRRQIHVHLDHNDVPSHDQF